MQVGYIGGLLLSPVVTVVAKIPIKRALQLVTPVTPILGGAVMLGVLMRKDLDVAGVDDRAYRLSQNASQLRIDQVSTMGGVFCCAASILGKCGLQSTLALTGFGMSSGLLMFAGEKVIDKIMKQQTK